MSDNDTLARPGGPVLRLGLAAICGVVAMGLLYLREEQMILERSGGARTPILVAKVDLNPGERLNPDNLGTQEVPRAYVHINAISATDQEKVVGRKVYHRIRQNQPLLWTEFDPPERERQAQTLPKGLRLTPVAIGEQLSKSRFLSPGDYIDILAHFNLGSERGSITTTMLQQVQVLEIIGQIAMVAVTPEQLEQLVFARSHGTLTVGIRNREDIGKPSLPSVTFLTLLGNVAPAPPPTLPPPTPSDSKPNSIGTSDRNRSSSSKGEVHK